MHEQKGRLIMKMKQSPTEQHKTEGKAKHTKTKSKPTKSSQKVKIKQNKKILKSHNET